MNSLLEKNQILDTNSIRHLKKLTLLIISMKTPTCNGFPIIREITQALNPLLSQNGFNFCTGKINS